MNPRIGSLFTGYAGLDQATRAVVGGEVMWHCEYEPPSKQHPKPTQAAARLLAYRFPHIPNLGDVSQVDWAALEPVDVITGGFPCTDVSLAGLGAGLREGTRSGMWNHMAAGINVLRPGLVVIENVRGLLSAHADSALEPCPWCVGDGSASGLRALGAVLGDLASIGYDARWCGLRAADVGAPHGRFRIFITAWPVRDTNSGDRDGWASAGLPRETGPAPGPATDADGDRHGQRGTGGRGAQESSATCGPGATPAYANGDAVREQPVAECWSCGAPQPGHDGLRDASADGFGSVRDGHARRGRGGSAHHDRVDADPTGQGRQHGRSRPAPTEPTNRGTPVRVGPPELGRRSSAPADSGGDGREGCPERHLRSETRVAAPLGGDPAGRVLDWGAYAPAIRRWEHTLGRVAPAPTQLSSRGGTQLSPRFVEWMQGLPEGWVTDVPGLSRNDQLRMLGNGVVPQQAEAALRFLLTPTEMAGAA